MILNASFCNSNSRDAAMRAQRYICDEAKVPIGGINSYGCGVSQWCTANLAVKIFYRKQDKGKHYNLVIGFDPADKITTEMAMKFGKRIARYFPDRYVIFAVHTNTKHIHIHFLISYTTIYGEQKGMKKSALSDLKNYVSGIAREFNLCPVRMKGNDWKPFNALAPADGKDIPELEIDEGDYLAEPEEILFEGLPKNTASNNVFSSTPCYIPTQKVINNYNITYNVNCTQPRYIKNNYDGNRNYNWDKAYNANQAQPALPAKQSVDYTRDDMNAPANLDFSIVLPKDSAELSDNAPVNPIVSVPNDVIEYGVSIRGFATNEFRFSDYFSALQFCNSYRNAGYQVSIYPIRNGKVNPFCTYF